MPPSSFFRGRLPALSILAAASVWSCTDQIDFDFPNPSEPFETTLFDLVGGPIDRPSGFDIVSGRGTGVPRAVRVDQTGEWDVAFAVIDGQELWLPRGFFESLEESSGIQELSRAFSEVGEAPGDRDLYETEEPLPVRVGRAYAIRSRNDPGLSLPCTYFALLEVTEIEVNPSRVGIRFLWNPNCDDRDVTPGDVQ